MTCISKTLGTVQNTVRLHCVDATNYCLATEYYRYESIIDHKKSYIRTHIICQSNFINNG